MIHQRPSDRKSAALLDSYGRTITYLRVSVTDRCDLRCTYCMSETMQFLPKTDVLSLEELDRLCGTFIDLGVEKIRLTGGEPLVRRDIMKLVERLSERIRSGALKELTLTTNGTQLKRFAWDLADLGIQRINVSLDTKDRETFKRITRRDALDQVLDGITEAQKAGIKIKINTVALRQDNEQEIPELIKWAHGQGHDLTLIETMPLGDVEGDRTEQFVSLAKLRHELESYWTLTETPDQTGGPARYVDIKETGGRLGFITPLSHNFCGSCNRIRVTCTGTLFTCLGHEQAVQLRDPLRAPDGDVALPAAIKDALAGKPRAHTFLEETLSTPSVRRHMSLTGG